MSEVFNPLQSVVHLNFCYYKGTKKPMYWLNLFHHNLLTNRARNLFKPFKEESLLALLKKPGNFELKLFGVTPQLGP